MDDIQGKLRIAEQQLAEINSLLLDPQSRILRGFLDVVRKYGTPDEINRKAEAARYLPWLLERVEKSNSTYLEDLRWLIDQRARNAFISVPEFRYELLGHHADEVKFDESSAVTLQISGLVSFPWLIAEAKQALAERELVPRRFVRTRNLKESEQDRGDLLAIAAAIQIIGANYAETLDAAIDQPQVGAVPDEHGLQWMEEFLHFYTNYGIKQVLSGNSGSFFAGCLLHKLGIDIEFKGSVSPGNDNPYALLWAMVAAKLFSRQDGTTPLVAIDLSSSFDDDAIELCAEARRALNFESVVRFEYPMSEAWKSASGWSRNRREQLAGLIGRVRNISANHTVAEPLEGSYLAAQSLVNGTARALAEHGLTFLAARNLHHAMSEIPA